MSAAMMNLVTPSGERHGIINRLGNSCPDNGFKHFKPEDKSKAEKLKKEEHRIVKARYLNLVGPQERLTKPYMRWAGDPIDIWHMIPGEVYEVPMGLVNEINNNPGLAQRSEVVDASGIPTKRDGMNKKIHQLIPVEF